MSDPLVINEIKNTVTIPVMAKARIGHYVEAQILEALGTDYIDESEVHSTPTAALFTCFVSSFVMPQHLPICSILPVMQVLTPADDIHHINKHNFKVPFVCGCRDLGEALRRIAEGAAMIRTKVNTPPLLCCSRHACCCTSVACSLCVAVCW